MSLERGGSEVIKKVPDQGRLPEIHVQEVGIARTSDHVGTCAGLPHRRRQNFLRTVNELEGTTA